MTDIHQILTDAVARNDAPFLVAMVADKDDVLWEGFAGQANPRHPADLTTKFRLFSMTKAVGSLAAMMMVDRGKVTLDTPAAEIMPEAGTLQVLESIGPEGPVYRPPATPVTLRHLLTHTSGLCYGEWHQKMHELQVTTNHPHIFEGTLKAMEYPLMFDPGTQWSYGLGVDWAGRMVQVLDGRPIDVFVQDEILSPLGMKDTGFEAEPYRDELADLMVRGTDGTFSPLDWGAPSRPEIYGMGSALYGTAPDYVRLLQTILRRGELDGYRVIGADTIEQMFVNQIGDVSVETLRTTDPSMYVDAVFFPEHRKTHSAGFVRMEEDVPGMRSAGSLSWAGAANTHYWIDPVKGIVAVLMTSTLPFCDPQYMSVYDQFERAVYSELVD